MNRSLGLLDPANWSLWVKFLVGIAVGLIILIIPAYLFARDNIFQLGGENAQAFVTQIGVKQASAVNNALVQARTTLENFTENADNERVIVGYLLRNVRTDTQTYLPNVTDDQIAQVFRSSLINPAASAFDSVRLLDRNGQVVVNVSVSTAIFEPTDGSQSAAYLEIQEAQLQGQSNTIAVSQGETATVVELVDTIFWRDGSPLGYVVTVLNNARNFANNLRLDAASDNYSAYSFLTTAQGALLAPSLVREQAVRANRSPIVERALSGQSSAATYIASDGAEYIGYSTPLGGTPFVLVTQAPASVVYNSLENFFQVRSGTVGAGVLALLVLLALAFNQLITPALNRLRRAQQALADGNFDVEVPDTRRGDEIGQLATSFVNMRDQMQTLLETLENRVAVRTRDISTTQEISRFATTQRDLQTLMDRVVDLIVERFTNIYHAQIFLIDDDGQYAVLRSSTGEAGKQLLSRGHRLGVGSLSVIGQVTQQGEIVVARDAAESQIHRRNEFLPNTRAELAIPLRVGETIIGALDVQSTTRDTFDEDQIAVLQTMADQIAVAIQNTLLYQESERRFAQLDASDRAATRQAWQEFIHDQRVNALTREAGFATAHDTVDLRQQAITRGELVVGQATDRNTVPLAVPVILRGQVLGAVEYELPAQNLSEERLELARELANRLALSLDNARLFQQSQRATERERLVNDIAAKLTAQTSINDILQTAVREVGQALRAPQVSIHLRGTGESNGHGSNGTNGSGAAAD